MAEMTEEQRKAFEEKLRSMSPEELKEFQKKQCIFCRMVSGEVAVKKVYEDEKCFAVLDINPAAAGHILLLPKEHYPILQQMPDEEVAHLAGVAKGFSQAFLQALKVEGTSIFAASGAAAGQRAQHVMIHLIPRKEGDGIPLALHGRAMPEKELAMVHHALKPFADKIFGVQPSAAGPAAGPAPQNAPTTSPQPRQPANTPAASTRKEEDQSGGRGRMGEKPDTKEPPSPRVTPTTTIFTPPAPRTIPRFQPPPQEEVGEEEPDDAEEEGPPPQKKKEEKEGQESAPQHKKAPPQGRSSLDDIADFLTKP